MNSILILLITVFSITLYFSMVDQNQKSGQLEKSVKLKSPSQNFMVTLSCFVVLYTIISVFGSVDYI